MKSEKLQLYSSTLKEQKRMLDLAEKQFFHELKAITYLTQNETNKLHVEPDEDNLQIYIFFETNPKIIGLINLFLQDANQPAMPEDGVAEYLVCIDLDTELFTIIQTKYKDLLEALKTKANQEIKDLSEENHLIEIEAKKIWFRLFHPRYKTLIQHNKEAINGAEDLIKLINSEMTIYEGDKIERILKTAKDEYKNVFGVDLTVRKEEFTNE
jgi:hypothetical protein